VTWWFCGYFKIFATKTPKHQNTKTPKHQNTKTQNITKTICYKSI